MKKARWSLLGRCLAAAPLSAAGDSSGACATTGTGTCTLRDAMTYANARAGSSDPRQLDS